MNARARGAATLRRNRRRYRQLEEAFTCACGARLEFTTDGHGHLVEACGRCGHRTRSARRPGDPAITWNRDDEDRHQLLLQRWRAYSRHRRQEQT